MKKATIYKFFLWSSICSFLIGFYLVQSGNSIGDFLIGLGFIFAMIILVIGLKDVFSNEGIELSERIMWVIVFVLITPIAGALYFPILKREFKNKTVSNKDNIKSINLKNINYSDVL